MKKTMLRIVSVTLCLVMALFSMMACDMFDGKEKEKKIEKSEIPANALYEFSAIQNMVIENSEELADKTETFVKMYTETHVLQHWDQNLNKFEKLDSLLCKDGTITFTNYYGKGSASFINGSRIYPDYDENLHTLGTYSGTDVTIDKSAEENEFYTDAYLTGDTFIICVEEVDSEGVVIKYEIVFKPVQ